MATEFNDVSYHHERGSQEDVVNFQYELAIKKHVDVLINISEKISC